MATKRGKQGAAARSHFIIPDQQIKANVPLDHLEWAGRFAAEYKPDRIINIGDGADMPSLSSFDVGKKSFEGRSYRQDIEAFQDGMAMFMRPINRAMQRGNWKPTFDYTLGNHENRINRAIENDRKLEGLISTNDLCLKEMGWRVHDFLNVVVLDGVHYSHYFTSGVMGRPASSARVLLNKKHVSCVMGHVQKVDVAFDYTPTGKRLTGLFIGTFYQHKETYRDPQSNAADYHAVWWLSDVHDGEFNNTIIPIDQLKNRYA